MIRSTLIVVTIASNILTVFGAGDDLVGVKPDSPRYYAQVTQSTDTRACLEEIVIKGKGIDDTFKGECITDGLSFLTNEQMLLIGDPDKNPYALYSDTASSLKIVQGIECKQKIFKRERFQPPTVTELVMTVKDCDALRGKISDQLRNNKDIQLLSVKPGQHESTAKPNSGGSGSVQSTNTKTSGPNPWVSTASSNPKLMNTGATNLYYSVTSEAEAGGCIQSIVIKGRGVSDRYQGPCDDIATVYLLPDRSPTLLLKSSRLTLYSDSYGAMYVVKDDDDCASLTYTSYITQTTISTEPLSPDLCAILKDNLKIYLEEAQTSGQWQITNLIPQAAQTYQQPSTYSSYSYK